MAVAIFPGVVVSLGVPEWGRGTDAIGAVVIGMDATGVVAIGTAIGTVITVTITVIFIGGFGFPGWWGWGWGGYPYGGYPYYGYYDYGYPYGYNGYGYGYQYPGYGYGNYGYGNGDGYANGNRSQYASPTQSKVAELQRRLSRAGYYRGSVDGILGPQTRRAIRAYESDHGYADAG